MRCGEWAKAPRWPPGEATSSGAPLRLSPEADSTPPAGRSYRPAHAPTSPRRRPDRRRARRALARPGAGRAGGVLIAPPATVPIAWRRTLPRAASALVGHTAPAAPPHRRLHRPRLRRGVPALPPARRPTTRMTARVIAVCAFALRHRPRSARTEPPGPLRVRDHVLHPSSAGRCRPARPPPTEQAERLRDLTEPPRARAGADRPPRCRPRAGVHRSRAARRRRPRPERDRHPVRRRRGLRSTETPRSPAAPLHAIRALGGARRFRHLRRLLASCARTRTATSSRPQPGLAQLDRAGRARPGARGVKVSVAARPASRASSPPSLDLSAYRILQEALTNVRKHARGAPRHGCPSSGSRPKLWLLRPRPPAPAPDASAPGDGHGLVGNARAREGSTAASFPPARATSGGFEAPRDPP